MEENFTVIPRGEQNVEKRRACDGIIEICEKCLGRTICIEDCILQKSKWLYNKITNKMERIEDAINS